MTDASNGFEAELEAEVTRQLADVYEGPFYQTANIPKLRVLLNERVSLAKDWFKSGARWQHDKDRARIAELEALVRFILDNRGQCFIPETDFNWTERATKALGGE